MIRLTILAFLLFLLCFYPLSYAAVGDTQVDCEDVAASGTKTFRPGAGVEWILHAVYFERNTIIQRTDGTDTTDIHNPAWIGPDHFMFNPAVHLTNGNYLQAVNQDGSNASVICYDGVQTK